MRSEILHLSLFALVKVSIMESDTFYFCFVCGISKGFRLQQQSLVLLEIPLKYKVSRTILFTILRFCGNVELIQLGIGIYLLWGGGNL